MAADDETQRILHRTIRGVGDDRTRCVSTPPSPSLIELNNHLTKLGGVQQTSRTAGLMVAPLAAHIAEELWAKLGHSQSLADEPFPTADPALLVADTSNTRSDQRQGSRPHHRRRRPRRSSVEAAALADPKIVASLAGLPRR